jgi:hypothetical protein
MEDGSGHRCLLGRKNSVPLSSAVMIVGALPPAVIGLIMYGQIGGSMTAGAVKG